MKHIYRPTIVALTTLARAFLPMALVGCPASPTPPTVDPAHLVIYASPSTYPGLTGLKLHYSAIQIVESDTPDGPQRVVDLGAAPAAFDVVAFPKMHPDLVGTFAVAPGYISQIRFVVDTLEGRAGPNNIIYGKLPSGAETGLKARPSTGSPLKIDDRTRVEVTVDFKATESVNLIRAKSGQPTELIVNPVTTFTPGAVSNVIFDRAMPRELAVTFKDTAQYCDPQGHCSMQSVTRERVDELNATIGATVLKTLPGTQTYLMRLPDGMTLDEGIAFYKASGLILGVAKNYEGRLGAIPNDPGFLYQWHLDNFGQYPGATPGADIQATFAWNGSVGSTAVRVAVVDSCFEPHEDLYYDYSDAYNVGDMSLDVSCSGLSNLEYIVHGTAVAGAVGALGNNGSPQLQMGSLS